METVLTLNIDKNVVDINLPLGPITKQLAGIITLEQDIDYKELLTDSLMEKYL
jgi:hypothetical protein